MILIGRMGPRIVRVARVDWEGGRGQFVCETIREGRDQKETLRRFTRSSMAFVSASSLDCG